MAISIFGSSSVKPAVYTPDALEQATECSGGSCRSRITLRQRAATFACSITMLGDAFRLIAYGIGDCWRNRTIRADGMSWIAEGAKYLVLTVSALVLGILFPRAVVWLESALGLVKPAPGIVYTCASKVARFVVNNSKDAAATAILAVGVYYLGKEMRKHPNAIPRIVEWYVPKILQPHLQPLADRWMNLSHTMHMAIGVAVLRLTLIGSYRLAKSAIALAR